MDQFSVGVDKLVNLGIVKTIGIGNKINKLSLKPSKNKVKLMSSLLKIPNTYKVEYA